MYKFLARKNKLCRKSTEYQQYLVLWTIITHNLLLLWIMRNNPLINRVSFVKIVMFLLWIYATNPLSYQHPVDKNVHKLSSTRISHFCDSLIMWIKPTKVILFWPHRTSDSFRWYWAHYMVITFSTFQRETQPFISLNSHINVYFIFTFYLYTSSTSFTWPMPHVWFKRSEVLWKAILRTFGNKF